MARILLADDDAATRDVIQRALTTDGHEVIITKDGAEALELLEGRNGRIDLLISDLQMSGLNGIELVEKGLKASPRLQVILISGFVSELNRAEQFEGQGGLRHRQTVYPQRDTQHGEAGVGVSLRPRAGAGVCRLDSR
jgi:CheY-like chemotaxis protein